MNDKDKPFSLADAVVAPLLAVLAVCILLFFVNVSAQQTFAAADDTELIYTISFRSVEDELGDGIAVGDKVVDSVKNRIIGEIISVSHSPSVSEIYSSDTGEMVTAEKSGFRDITITVKATPDDPSGSMSVSGCRIAVGRTLNIRTRTYSGSGVCVSLRTEAGN